MRILEILFSSDVSRTQISQNSRQKYVYGIVVNVTRSCFSTVGTGVVTSVPSDAPDDIAALRDLKKKAVIFIS